MGYNRSRSRKKKKVLNVVELGDEGLVYIRLEDGKYLLNADSCYRCGTTADCFGNYLEGDRLEVVCEYDYFDEVRCLFLCLLQERMMRLLSLLSRKISGRIVGVMDCLFEVFDKPIRRLNLRNV